VVITSSGKQAGKLSSSFAGGTLAMVVLFLANPNLITLPVQLDVLKLWAACRWTGTTIGIATKRLLAPLKT